MTTHNDFFLIPNQPGYVSKNLFKWMLRKNAFVHNIIYLDLCLLRRLRALQKVHFNKGSLKKPFMVQTSFFDWKRNYVISGPWMLRVQNLRQILDFSSTTWRQLPEADERIAKKNFRIAKSWIEKLKRFCGFFFEAVSTTRTDFVDTDNFLLVLVPVIGYPEKSSAKAGGRNHFLRLSY